MNYLLFLVLLIPAAYPVQAATYYVRVDGGPNSECNGSVDVAAPAKDGSCAWNHPFEALGVQSSKINRPHIQGGDTLIIQSGSYRMGYTPGIYDSGPCSVNWTWGCTMETPPAGPSPDNPTRILGEGWDSGCQKPPELFGVEKATQVISMFDTSNIEMQCLDITDHEQCSTNPNVAPNLRCKTKYPFGDYALRGIEMRNVSNWYLRNISIHGITGPGIRGAEVQNWTVRDSSISYNNAGGINGETPAKKPNQFYGTLQFSNVDISWNGCVEAYPETETIVKESCIGGNRGGYGDGVGLQETAGTWLWDRCSFMGNVEDGLDLLYMRSKTGISYISNSRFGHNAGNDLKIGGSAIIKNNILQGDCNYFTGKPITKDVVPCRGNATLAITLQKNNSSVTLLNNSMGGNADSIIAVSSINRGLKTCDGSEGLFVANTIFRGGSHFQHSGGKKVDAYYQYGTCNGFRFTATNNLFYNTKDGSRDCQTSTDSICQQDPQFVLFDESSDTYDFRLKGDSPAISTGLPLQTEVGYNSAKTTPPASDHFGTRRIDPDMGMYEFPQ